MRPNSPWAYLLACVTALAPGAASQALTSDREQPVRIEADRVTLDEGRGVSLYEGRVQLTQGSLRLTADRVRVFTADKKLSRIEAEGDLAVLETRTDDGREVRAEARRMEFQAAKRSIILLEQARLQQGPNQFASERIVYDLEREIVNAGDGEGGQRVEVVIVPETDEAGAPSGLDEAGNR